MLLNAHAREPHFSDDSVTVWHGDCLDVMREMPDNSVDSIVTDPPYGLGFMGKAWDDLPPGLPWAQECLRVLKPGGHLLAFGGTRTWHRLAVAVEDAGFEMRDSIAWLYGSGFPKSLDVSKAIDRAAGAAREVVGIRPGGLRPGHQNGSGGNFANNAGGGLPDITDTLPATPDAERWQGWGTALKPAFEPIVVARKPIVGTVAGNVLALGTGALNIDGCRVDANGERFGGGAAGSSGFVDGYAKGSGFVTSTTGRWPTNVLLDGDAAAALDEQSGVIRSGGSGSREKNAAAGNGTTHGAMPHLGYTEHLPSEGGASRFFPVFRQVCGAESAPVGALGPLSCERPRGHEGRHREREDGHVWDDEPATEDSFPTFRYQAKAPTRERVRVGDVAHPTVKPLALMRWLVRLITPPGGVVLDPFAGSGTTVEAAILEGFQVIGIEREADYLPLIEARIARNRITDEGLPEAADALALFDIEEPA